VRKLPKVPAKKAIETQCLVLWSRCVRTRDRVCRATGADTGLQAHHIRSVSHKATYLCLENGLTLSNKIHCLQKFNPERFQDVVISIIGDEEYQRLKVKSQREWKPTMPWLLETKDYLKTTLKALEADYGKLNP
jgi:hypothetical protein